MEGVSTVAHGFVEGTQSFHPRAKFFGSFSVLLNKAIHVAAIAA